MEVKRFNIDTDLERLEEYLRSQYDFMASRKIT